MAAESQRLSRRPVGRPIGLGLVLTLVAAACGSDVTESGAGGASTTTQSSTGTGTANGGSGTASGVSTGGAAGAGGGVAGSGGGSAVLCNPDAVLCDSPTPSCPIGEVPSVVGACWGPCVPILSCQTEASCDECQTGMCAQYVAWTTEYRCVMPSLQCSALACSCLAPYFCAAPFDSCQEAGSADYVVTCSCPAC